MMSEELSALIEDGNRELIIQHCLQFGIPADFRTKVYPILLGVNEDAINELWEGPLLPQVNQRVIALDCHRTRQTLPYFQSDETKGLMERLLSMYCESHGVSYKQGLNELIAPFLALGIRPAVAYKCMSRLIARFLPQVFTDNDFLSVQCVFRMLRLMLLYHDPELCRCLDQYDIMPELYATPWFLTLFSYNQPLEFLFTLWDQYLLREHELLHFFVAMALIIHQRQQLFQVTHSTLPEVLRTMRFQSVEHILSLVSNAEKIQCQTPLSFQNQLRTVAFTHGMCSSQTLTDLEELVCLPISADETLCSKYNDTEGSTNQPAKLQFVLLDCRPRQLYDLFHAPDAIHLDPSLLLDVERLDILMQDMIRYKGRNLCLYTSGTSSVTLGTFATSSPANSSNTVAAQTLCMFALHFLQRSFPFIGSVEGGDRALYASMSERGDSNLAALVHLEHLNSEDAWSPDRILQFPSAVGKAGSGPSTEDSSTNNIPSSSRSKAWGATLGLGTLSIGGMGMGMGMGMGKMVSKDQWTSVKQRVQAKSEPLKGWMKSFTSKTYSSSALVDDDASSVSMPLTSLLPIEFPSIGHMLDQVASLYVSSVSSEAVSSNELPSVAPPAQDSDQTYKAANLETVDGEELQWLQNLREFTQGSTIDDSVFSGKRFVGVFDCTFAHPTTSHHDFSNSRLTLAVSSLVVILLERISSTQLSCVSFWYLGTLSKISTRKSDPSLLTLKFFATTKSENSIDDALSPPEPVQSPQLIEASFRFDEGVYMCHALLVENFRRVFMGVDYSID
jgi:hypothetical protein